MNRRQRRVVGRRQRRPNRSKDLSVGLQVALPLPLIRLLADRFHHRDEPRRKGAEDVRNLLEGLPSPLNADALLQPLRLGVPLVPVVDVLDQGGLDKWTEWN
jgi:hypothetical protein